jgi:hypothetical protein
MWLGGALKYTVEACVVKECFEVMCFCGLLGKVSMGVAPHCRLGMISLHIDCDVRTKSSTRKILSSLIFEIETGFFVVPL